MVRHWCEMPDAVLRLRRDAGALDALRARIGAVPETRAVYEVSQLIAREAASHGA